MLRKTVDVEISRFLFANIEWNHARQSVANKEDR